MEIELLNLLFQNMKESLGSKLIRSAKHQEEVMGLEVQVNKL